MLRASLVVQTPTLRIERFDHPPGPHRDPPQERAADYSLNIVEQGRFALRAGKRQWELGPGMVFVAHPGVESNGQRQVSSGRGTEIFLRRGGCWVNPGWHLDSGR
jgi:hypothetical protein